MIFLKKFQSYFEVLQMLEVFSYICLLFEAGVLIKPVRNELPGQNNLQPCAAPLENLETSADKSPKRVLKGLLKVLI